MKKKLLKALEYTLTTLVAIALLYLAFRKIDWQTFVSDLRTTRWFWVMMSVAASFAALIFRAERWRDMLLPLDGSISRIKVWDAYNFGNLFSVFVPGVGEFVRCGAVSTKKAGYDRVLGTAIMERAWDIVAIVVIFITAIACRQSFLGNFIEDNILGPLGSKFSLWWILVLLVLLAAGGLVAIYKMRSRSKLAAKAADFIDGIVSGLAAFGKMQHKWRFAIDTVLVWLSYIMMSWFVFKAVPGLSQLTFADALLVSAIGNLASVIPVPGGMGAYHYLVALTLSGLYGQTWELGLLFATLTHETRSILLVIVAAVSYGAVLIRKRKITDK